MIINENCECCKSLAEKLKEYDEVFEGHAAEVTDLELKLYEKTKECEEWKNKYYSSTTEVKADLIKQLDQLKAENEELKEKINKLLDERNKYLDNWGINLIYKQTLIDIKPILELYANSKVGEEQSDGTYKLSGGIWDSLGFCTTTYDPRPARQALQKISEVLDEENI